MRTVRPRACRFTAAAAWTAPATEEGEAAAEAAAVEAAAAGAEEPAGVEAAEEPAAAAGEAETDHTVGTTTR